jgi:hypothetical protein
VYKTILTAAQAFNDVSIFEAAFSDDSWLEPFRSDSKLLDQLAMMVMIKPSTPELLRLNTLVFNMCDRFECMIVFYRYYYCITSLITIHHQSYR